MTRNLPQNRIVYPIPYPNYPHRREIRPTTWPGIIRQRPRFEIKVNEAVSSLLGSGINPTKRQICDKLGLDYDNGDDRDKVSNALHDLKETFDYAWKEVYVGLGHYDKDYAELSANREAYEKWKNEEKGELYNLLQQYDLTEEDIRRVLGAFKIMGTISCGSKSMEHASCCCVRTAVRL